MIIERKITLGEIFYVLVTVAAVILYLGSDHNSVGQLADELKKTNKTVEQMQLQMTANSDRLRADMTLQFSGVRADIANLPDVRAQVGQQERRITDLETSSRDMDKRMARVEGVMQPSTPYRMPR